MQKIECIDWPLKAFLVWSSVLPGTSDVTFRLYLHHGKCSLMRQTSREMFGYQWPPEEKEESGQKTVLPSTPQLLPVGGADTACLPESWGMDHSILRRNSDPEYELITFWVISLPSACLLGFVPISYLENGFCKVNHLTSDHVRKHSSPRGKENPTKQQRFIDRGSFQSVSQIMVAKVRQW